MKFIILLFVFSLPLFAEDFTFNKESGQALPNYIAQLKMVRGKVYKFSTGAKKEVKVGTRFYKNDTLVTDADSFAQILVVDDTVMTLGSKSELNFADFKFVDKTDRQIVYSFIKGQIRGLIKNKAKEGDIVIKTSLGIMGIRGTEILVNHQTIRNLEVSEFALLSGSVQVTDDKNQNHDLVKPDRLIIVQNANTKQSASERNKLSDEELNVLHKKDKFMNFFVPTDLTEKSALTPLFLQEADALKTDTNSNTQPVIEVEKKGWRDTLRKLNEKLKEYQSTSH